MEDTVPLFFNILDFGHFTPISNAPGFYRYHDESLSYERTPNFVNNLRVVERFYILNICSQSEMSYTQMTAAALLLLYIFEKSPDEWPAVSWLDLLKRRQTEINRNTSKIICINDGDGDFMAHHGDSALTNGLTMLTQCGFLHYAPFPESYGMNALYMPSRKLIQKIVNEHAEAQKRNLRLK